MAISLAVNFNLPGGARLEFATATGNGTFSWNDDTETLTTRVELRTSVPNGRRLICAATMQIRNGTSTTLARQTNPLPGLNIDDVQHYFVQGTRETLTGYADAMAAFQGAANTPNARRAAMEAHFFSAGHIDSSLAGT